MGSHDVIGGIVSPVHDSYGKNSLVASKHRASMVKMALQTSDWIRMSDWEMQQDQWKRTRLTLQYHQVFSFIVFQFIIHTCDMYSLLCITSFCNSCFVITH